MKEFEVWIYDQESGCNQPIVCRASGENEARSIGKKYIKVWGLVGAKITKIRERGGDYHKSV